MMTTKNDINTNLLRALSIFLLTISFASLACQSAELLDPLIDASHSHSNPSLPSDEKDGYQPFRYDIIDTEKFLDLSKQIPTDIQEKKEIICVLGGTGVGKSTTVNYLINVPLIKVEKGDTKINGRRRGRKKETIEVDPECNLSKVAKIRDSMMSCTEWPECFQEEGSDLTFCDLPGFFNNCGIEKQITGALSIKKVIKKSKNVKALLFILSKQNLLSARGNVFTEMFGTLRLLLKEPKDFLPSIYFGFTKKEDWELGDFMAELEEYVSSLKEKLQKNSLSSNPDISSQVSKDYIETELLYLFLDDMLKRHTQNFFLINPLDASKRNPILQKLKKSTPIPKEAIQFVGDQELYHKTHTLYVKTLESGVHCLDIEKNYPVMIEEREEKAVQNAKIIAKEKGVREKKKDEERLKRIDNLLRKVDKIHKEQGLIRKRLSEMDTSEEVMMKKDIEIVKGFRWFSPSSEVVFSFRREFPIAKVERRIENGKITKTFYEKNIKNEYEAKYYVQKNKNNQKKEVKVIHKTYTFKKVYV